jgi:hypothetical protein
MQDVIIVMPVYYPIGGAIKYGEMMPLEKKFKVRSIT